MKLIILTYAFRVSLAQKVKLGFGPAGYFHRQPLAWDALDEELKSPRADNPWTLIITAQASGRRHPHLLSDTGVANVGHGNRGLGNTHIGKTLRERVRVAVLTAVYPGIGILRLQVVTKFEVRS